MTHDTQPAPQDVPDQDVPETAPPTPGPVSHEDPYAEAHLLDPYPLQGRLAELGPAVWLSRYGVYALTRYQAVVGALRDHERFCSGAGVGMADFRKEKPWRPPSLLLEADPPQHTRARQAMSGVISARALRAFRPAFQAAADALVDSLLERGVVDGVADIAEAYPLKVFPDAVGLPDDRRADLLPYGDMNFNAFGPRNELQRRSFEHSGYLHQWMAESCRRKNLAEGGLGRRLWALADSGDLAAEEAALLVRSLLTAGVDTTVAGLGNTLNAFLRFPDQWDGLHREPRLAGFAFDEALRWQSPLQTFYRTAVTDTAVDGVTVPAGHKVLLMLGAANRDRRHWGPDADVVNLDRDASGHVAFGMGIHQCVGQPIARLEADVLLATLARRVRAIEPAGEAVPRLNNTLHGWSSLPVRLVPA